VDADGLANLDEYYANLDPQDMDTDGDYMHDGWELNNSLNYLVNDALYDYDSDGATNLEEFLCDLAQGDFIGYDPNGYPIGDNYAWNRTDDLTPYNDDSDADYMHDGWELEYNLDPIVDDADLDLDNDNLINLVEWNLQFWTYGQSSKPNTNDSDDDGLNDYAERYNYFTNPCDNDTDGEGLIDSIEISGWQGVLGFYNSDPLNNNTDYPEDLINDYGEYIFGTNPNDGDTDGDFLSDSDEIAGYYLNNLGIRVYPNPNYADTDGDGIDDKMEIEMTDGYCTNPCSNDTDNDTINDNTEINTGISTTINGIQTTIYGDPTTLYSDSDSINDTENSHTVLMGI
jgi:hypothetical protein